MVQFTRSTYLLITHICLIFIVITGHTNFFFFALTQDMGFHAPPGVIFVGSKLYVFWLVSSSPSTPSGFHQTTLKDETNSYHWRRCRREDWWSTNVSLASVLHMLFMWTEKIACLRGGLILKELQTSSSLMEWSIHGLNFPNSRNSQQDSCPLWLSETTS